jgi:hypothetical protein
LILLLIIGRANHSAISRRKNVGVVCKVVLKLRTVAFVGKAIVAKLCDVECELFRNRPTMGRVK